MHGQSYPSLSDGSFCLIKRLIKITISWSENIIVLERFGVLMRTFIDSAMSILPIDQTLD